MKRFLVVLMVMGLSTAVLGFGGKKHGRMNGKKGCFDKIEKFEELKLTTEQKEKIEDLRLEFKKEMVDIDAKLERLRIEKREASKDNKFSEIKDLNEKLSEIRVEKMNRGVDLKEKIYTQLTDEQKKTMKELKLNKKFNKKGKMRKQGKRRKSMRMDCNGCGR